MTLRTATEVAKTKSPVIYNGIVYERILEAGYWYSDKGEQFSFVTLLDKRQHSVTRANSEQVELYAE